MQDLPDLIQAYNSLPAAEQRALALYRQSGPWAGGASFAYDINSELRANAVRAASRPYIDLIDRALGSYTLKSPATVYRAECDVTVIPSLRIGVTWRPKSFVSTSTWWENLNTHLASVQRGKTAAVLSIRLRHGTPAAYLGVGPSATIERELLLGRTDGFKILGVADGGHRPIRGQAPSSQFRGNEGNHR